VDQNVALQRRRAALAGTVAGTGAVFVAWRHAVRIDEAGFVVVLPKR